MLSPRQSPTSSPYRPAVSSHLPVIALVGRPNVGKSTLFNRFTGTRDALVADFAGLTRDRQYGFGKFEGRTFMVVDTGGLMPSSGDPLADLAESQARIAIQEADCVLFLVDIRAGLNPSDHEIAGYLRKLGKPVCLLANKAEGLPRSAVGEFYELGLDTPMPVSAVHGDGIQDLLRQILPAAPEGEDADPEEPPEDGSVYVAIVGRPNVGKSTLVNRLIGEERVLAADMPGTTRDSIKVPFHYQGQDFVLIDTAGVRRRGKVSETIEKFSIVKTLEAIERAHVVIAVVDAQGDIGEQDARLLGLIAHRGRGMVLAVNKWDGLDESERKRIKTDVDFKLPFLDYVPVHHISAKRGTGLARLFAEVQKVRASAFIEMPTPRLNQILEKAMARHAPPAIVGRRIKLRYVHQGGRNPPKIIIHGNQTERVPVAYKRFLSNEFRRAFKLTGVPLEVAFKTGDNPFKGRKNVLTPRQIKKKKRMMEHFKD